VTGHEDDHLACPQCGSGLGRKCLDLLGAGPQAVPSVERDIPHSGRKRRGQATATRTAKAVPAVRKVAGSSSAGRRAARKTDTTASAWLALAERQRRSKG
jgi:hypothetical protein